MTFDPVDIAQKIVNRKENRPSLVPETSTGDNLANLLPARPTYTPYQAPEFSWDVPMSERPQGTENWIWSKSRWAKDNFDREHQVKGEEAYRKYLTDLTGWQDAMKIAQHEQERREKQEQVAIDRFNQQLRDQGLVSVADPYDMTPIYRPVIENAQTEWQKAHAAGDQHGMDYWHGVAEKARMDAGWGSGGADGSLTAKHMTPAGSKTWQRQSEEDQIEYAKDKDRKIYALDKWERLGMADAEVASILDVPEGAQTNTRWYQEAQIALSKEQLAASMARAASGGGGGGGGSSSSKPTQTDRYNNATGAAYNAVNDAINAGVSYDQIEQSIVSQAGDLKSVGVDYKNVLTYLDEVYPAEPKDARPFWQKALDFVAPFRK